ncbi:MAG: aminotransferase class V-fold PLP-dependent enzyme, partial [Planctomycetes bacterium]|nr:aminotransferase class V-fold PLP-dependent enzyme [Planctomycetota bacterium]
SWLNELPPYQGGGEMIKTVSFEKTTYNDLPYKFEAGTPDMAGAIGLGAALDYVQQLGLSAIRQTENNLMAYALEALREVKELRLTRARTCEQANRVLERLVTDHNRRFAKAASKPTGAHRRLGAGHRLEPILSSQWARVVSNDYVVRWANRHYQLLPPVYPGERGGRVVIEHRLDGSMAIRFGKRYLAYREVEAASDREEAAGPPEVSKMKPAKVWKPPADHPWRKRVVKWSKAPPRGGHFYRGRIADISIGA